MSDSEYYREAYRDELEDARECPLHPGYLMYPDRGIPCTACEDGDRRSERGDLRDWLPAVRQGGASE
jgi:hypothetical protein